MCQTSEKPPYRGASCVVKALATVLKTVLRVEHIACHTDAAPNASIRILSYRDDFTYLWALGDEEGLPRFFNRNDQDGVVVVIWDANGPETGSTVADLSKYLTPLDWVVWYSLTLADQSSLESIPRVFLLDLASNTVRRADSVQFFDLFPNRNPAWMPWLRIFRVVPTDRHQLGFKDLVLELCRSTHHGGTVPELEPLRRIWRGTFLKPTEPSDNHAIANLVGPSLFLRDEGSDPSRQALEKFLRRLALLPPLSGQHILDRRIPWIKWDQDPWKDRIDRLKMIEDRALHFLLVDDVAVQHGWGKTIALALGLDYHEPKNPANAPQLIAKGTAGSLQAKLFATESATAFLQSLCVATHDSSTVKPPKFGWECNVLDSHNRSTRKRIDVLLLDLRLFQGQDLLTECRFFRQLVDWAKRFCDDDTECDEDLPWKGFTSSELDALERWLDRVEQKDPTASRKDIEYLDGLVLLPRLIAILDFSLPIILFSSTERRQIIDALKPYRNIITHFAKPPLQLGQDTRTAEELADKFRVALLEALDMTMARRLCNRIVTRRISCDFDVYRAKLPAVPADGVWRVQLMLDETGPPASKPQDRLKVGGVLAIYPPGQDPAAFSSALYRQFPKIRDSKEFTRDNVESITAAVNELCTQRGVLVVPISLTGNLGHTVYSDVDKSDELHDERIGDNLHRELVRCVTELAIYCVARRVLPSEADVEFSVMAATRVRQPRDERTVRALWDRWGVATEYVGDGKLYLAKELLKRIVQRQAENPVFPKAVRESAKTFCDYVEEADRLLENEGGMASATREELRKQLIHYFDKKDARPLVEEVMREYRHSRFEPRADIVRAFSLNAFGTKEASQIHALHFLSDSLLRVAASGPSVRELNEIAIDGRYGERLVRLFEAHRLSVRGLLPQSLSHGGIVALKDGKNTRATSVVICEIQRAAQELTGPDFLVLVSLLRDTSPTPQSPSSVRHGTVIKKTQRGLYIRDSKREYYANFGYCTDFRNIEKGDVVTFAAVRQIGSWLAQDVKKESTS